MDWSARPDVFRRYGGPTRLTRLPPPADGGLGPGYDEALCGARVAASRVDAASLSSFFRDGFGLSCEKVAGPSRWTLRSAPSGGALYPCEAYVIRVDSDAAAVVEHYDVERHALAAFDAGRCNDTSLFEC